MVEEKKCASCSAKDLPVEEEMEEGISPPYSRDCW